MTGIQSVSPKRRDKQPGRDMISDLPLGIIHMILALVPTQDAVRTSILSKQWRYTWATLPQLAFYGDEDKVYHNKDRLMNFINRTFMLHRAPIHKFKLYVPESMYLPNCDQWLLRLSKNDLRELDLEGIDLDGSSTLYSFQKLTHLTIGGFMGLYPPPPTFKGFLCLRCLYLYLNASSDEVESLVASSPLLEDLKLYETSESSVVRIRAPKLKYLELSGAYEEISVYAPILVKMSVELCVVDDEFTAGHYLEQESSVCNYTELLGGLTNLESLSGDEYFTKYLRVGFNLCQDSLVFHHLKVISLRNVNFKDKKEISVVVRLIMDSPNLQNLEISTYHWHLKKALEAPHRSLWDSGCAPDSKFEKLRVVKIRNVRGMLHEMEFIKFLLKSSPVLETISVDRSYDGVYIELWLGFMDILVRYGQAECPNAKILYTQSGEPFPHK